jgi:WD40 repeat protein
MFHKRDVLKLILCHFRFNKRINLFGIKNYLIMDISLRLDRSIREEYTLHGHEAAAFCLTSLSNGKIASGSVDQTIRIWDGNKNYECERVIKGHSWAIWCLVGFPNNDIASGSADDTIRIWKADNDYECVSILTDHKGNITALLYNQNGVLISASYDNTIKVWDCNGEPNCILTIHLSGSYVNSLILLRNSNLAACSEGIMIFNNEYQYIKTLKSHEKMYRNLYSCLMET